MTLDVACSFFSTIQSNGARALAAILLFRGRTLKLHSFP